MKWKRVITRDANILLKSLVIKGISVGPTYALPEWHGFQNHFWTWYQGETGVNYLTEELKQFTDCFIKKAFEDPAIPQHYILMSKDICITGAEKAKQLSHSVHAQD